MRGPFKYKLPVLAKIPYAPVLMIPELGLWNLGYKTKHLPEEAN